MKDRERGDELWRIFIRYVVRLMQRKIQPENVEKARFICF